MAQLPSGAIGTAIFAVAAAIIALICGLVMIWLTWKHERYSYVALIAWASILTTLATLIEQTYYVIGWRDIFTATHVRKQSNLHATHPRLYISLTFGMSGLDLVLFWSMICFLTIEALLVMFWAIELASSVYGMLGKPRSILNRCHRLLLKHAKILAIVLPIVVDLVIQIPAVQNTDLAWFLLTHSMLLVSAIFSIVAVVLILVKYVGYRKKVQRMGGSSQRTCRLLNWRRGSDATSNSANTANHHGLYDSWLLPRFGVIILSLAFFEAYNIILQINQWRSMLSEQNEPLDISAPVASYRMIASIPRCLPAVALLIVFGTTRVFRARLYKAFWPKRWQRFDNGNTPLETPYQSLQTGAGWHDAAQAPKNDLGLTSASLRWDHGDQTFAGWESRRLDAHPWQDISGNGWSPTLKFGNTSRIWSSASDSEAQTPSIMMDGRP